MKQDEAPIRSHPEIVRRFHARLLTDSSGAPISSENRAAWLKARRNGVTATDVGRIVKLNGTFSRQRSPLMEAKLSGQEHPFLQVMQHGIDREPVIAAWVAEKFGIQPNSLLCRGQSSRHLATPDGIGPGVIAEIKTSTKPLDQALATYGDQLQWQLHVTGSERVLFVVENRNTLRKETRWVERDKYRIFILAQHADAFILEMDERRATARTLSETPARPQAAKLALQPPEAVQIAPPPRPPAAPTTTLASATAVEGDVDEARSWNDAERKKLVAGYVAGATVAELATCVGTTHRAVVFELSRLWLEPEGHMVDPTAERFGTYWNSAEEQTLRNLYSAGVSLPNIARKMQRDQLGIAFRLFENYIPQRPAARSAKPTIELVSEALGIGPALPAAAVSTVAEVARPAPGIPAQVAIQRQEVVLPPETVVGGLDPENDEEDNRHWSPMELRRLLSLYGDNEDMEIFEIARNFRTTSRAVVIALTSIVLDAQGPLEDPRYPKRNWTQGHVDAVHDLFRAGASLPQIAQATGRDQLSVAFRLLRDRLPGVSGLIEEFQTP